MRLKLWLAVAVLSLLAVLSLIWLLHDIDSYDQSYRQCMVSHGTLYYPSETYDQAAKNCAAHTPR